VFDPWHYEPVLARKPGALCRLDFVVLNELGYLPFAQSGG
jgi:hypothetical protein